MKTMATNSSVPCNSSKKSDTMLSLVDVVKIILDRLSPSQDATYRFFVHNFNSKLIGKCEFIHSCLHLFGDDEYLKQLFIQITNYQIKVTHHHNPFSIPNQETNNNVNQIQQDHYNVPSHDHHQSQGQSFLKDGIHKHRTDTDHEDQNEDETNELKKQGAEFFNRIERVFDSEIFQSVVHIFIGYKEGKIRLHKVKSKILSLLSNHEDFIEELDEILENMEAIIVMEKSKKRKRASSPIPIPRKSRGTTCKRERSNDMIQRDLLKLGVKNAENVEDMEFYDAALKFYWFVKRVHGEFGDK